MHKLRLASTTGATPKPYDKAGSYALAGENDLAFEWLNKAYELPIFFCFATDARFDSLRSDPRYEGLLHKLKLPEDAIARHLVPR